MVPDSTLVPVLIVLVGGVDGSKWFRSNCCIVAFFCFRASYFRSTFGVLWRSEINYRNLAVSYTSKLDSQFLSTSLWRFVPSIGTIVGLTLFGWCMFSCSLVLLFSCRNRYCSLRSVVWFRGSESVLFGSYIVAGNSCSEVRPALLRPSPTTHPENGTNSRVLI